MTSEMVALMNGIEKGYSPKPNFEDGVLNQAILEAVEKSAESGRWIKVPQFMENGRFSRV
ncbi:hypothetical protein LSG31_21155 [Fodinisporobacter ferrooxydans]|uniref:Gfo/Idh/MocA-like oxidoreductase C-terminal domain-containing protein n=1 Tax=Fodinisporobacter ferrooxydans TaxID=2901836 RepID=A0ABY4CME5_9BACL|nr:hypothetical protein LSG31_21155 [Alicyclobacillaceae bacterium MYW30-H2]